MTEHAKTGTSILSCPNGAAHLWQLPGFGETPSVLKLDGLIKIFLQLARLELRVGSLGEHPNSNQKTERETPPFGFENKKAAATGLNPRRRRPLSASVSLFT